MIKKEKRQSLSKDTTFRNKNDTSNTNRKGRNRQKTRQNRSEEATLANNSKTNEVTYATKNFPLGLPTSTSCLASID